MLGEYIYEKSKKEFIKGFNNQKEIEEILYYYKMYLEKRYNNLFKTKEEIEEKKDIILEREIKMWSHATNESKQNMLVKDEYMDKIGYLSNIAYNFAQQKAHKQEIELTEKQAKKYIDEMKSCLEKVRKFNLQLARNYLSESILDFEYACGKTECTSLRTGRTK